jgi:hypothetical protein
MRSSIVLTVGPRPRSSTIAPLAMAQFDDAIGQHGEPTRADAHDHVAAELGAFLHPTLDRGEEWRLGPRIRKSRIHRDIEDVLLLLIGAEDEFRLLRLPFRAQSRVAIASWWAPEISASAPTANPRARIRWWVSGHSP